jgi:hypothetical protein
MTIDRSRFAALVAFLCLQHPCIAGEAKAVVPFELQSGLPTAEVNVGGKLVTLFLDSGAFSAIALTPSSLAELSVNFSGTVQKWRDSRGTVFQSRGFSVPNVTLGGVEFGPLEGTEFLQGQETVLPQSGYLGFAFLRHYLAVFDYPAGRLRLFESGDELAMDANCGKGRFHFKVVNGVMQSDVETDAGPLLFQWDTGSTQTVLRPSAVGVQPSDQTPSMKSFARFEVGGMALGRTVVTFREFRAPAVDGVIGSDLLSSRVLCLDASRQIGALR